MSRAVAVIAYHSSPLIEPGTGDAGGMTVYVREVARVMAKLGVRTDVFTRSTGKVEVTRIFPGVRVVAIPAGPLGTLGKLELAGHIGSFVEGVRTFARGERHVYDVIHSHYWQSGIAGADLSRAWGVPLVHSNHTLAKVKNRHLPPGDSPEPATRLAGEAEVIAAADILVASTDEEWQHLACLYGASHDRLKTIYPGVDHTLFSPGSKDVARAELDLRSDEAVLAFVGRIQPLKGLDLAFRALEQLVSALDRDVRLLVVGGASGPTGGSATEDLAELAASLGIADSIRFEGPQPHERTPLFYRAADACVVCSFSESFGLSALEAQACGIPVVGTDVGGLRHIVRDGASGFLVESRDPSELAARSKTLLSDPDLHRSFAEEALRSSTAFTWDRTGQELAVLYECLITEQSPEFCTC